jgi:hypothetical protein
LYRLFEHDVIITKFLNLSILINTNVQNKFFGEINGYSKKI